MFNQLISECSDYEFKVNLEVKRPKSWLKTVSAFSNGIGGTIFFGVSDEGQIEGIENPQYISDKISELVNSRIDPVPNIQIQPIKENDKTIVALKVLPGSLTPYYYHSDGVREAFVRSGNQTIIIPSFMLYELILKGQNVRYDALVTNLLKSNYSFSFFEATFLDKTFTHITKEDYISFGLMNDDGYLTNAGVLLADQNIYRHSRVYCTRWNGLNKTALEEASDDAEYTGSIVKLLDSSLNFVKNNTKKRWKKAPRERIEMPEYDELAIREAIVNGLIHRKYTMQGAEVCVDIYDDRIEVTSPGGMVSGKKLNGDVDEKIPSVRRNPILADIFARMHFMDNRGSGFDKIKKRTNRLFNDNKNHVRFYATDIFFSVIIDNANYANDKMKGIINDTLTMNDIINKDINDTDALILNYIKKNKNITIIELIEITGKSRRTILRCIEKLKNKGLINRIGSKKIGHWEILD